MVLPTRDLTVLLVVTVVALVSFHWEAAFEFRTLEPLPIQTTSAEGEFTNVPEPIVVDHDGDRKNEVILAFDRSIAVYRHRKQDDMMVEQARYTTKSQPLIMTYIGPKQRKFAAGESQHQPVVLIMTADDFNVSCLSYPSLKLLWSSRVPGVARHVKQFQGAVLADHAMVADYTGLYKGDIGAVFLTLRFANAMDLGQEQGTAEGTLNNRDVKVSDGIKAEDEDSELSKDEKLALEYITHESFFAFDLTTGKLRWKYTSRDEHSRQALHEMDVDNFREDDQEEMSETAHDYRRHVAERAHHFEEGDWRLWKEDIVEKALPHQWYTTRHTSLTPARFDPARVVDGKGKKTRTVIKEPALGAALTGGLSALVTDHFEDPYKYLTHNYQHTSPKSSNNVLLFENADGISVVHLFTGKILTRLPLPPFRTYADANGDSTINSLSIEPKEGLVRLSTMYEEVRSINHSQVYTTRLPQHVATTARLLHKDAPHVPTEFAAPLLLPASTRFTAPGAGFRGPVGKTLAQILPDLDRLTIPDQAYFVIILNSQGMMYCLRSDVGEVQWAVDTQTGWAGLQALRSALKRPRTTAAAAGLSDPERTKRFDINKLEFDSTVDTKLSAILMPYAMDAKQTNPTGVLAVTPTGLVLVGPDGGILAREVTNMPTVSKTTLPVISDITSDGRNDILVVTHRAYHFYILTSGKSHVFPLLVACFLLLLMAVTALKIAEARKTKTERQHDRYSEASSFSKAH